MIRAGRGGAYAADWLDRNVIGIGWDFGGADIANMNREQIKSAYTSAHPAESKQKIAASVGQVYRFAHSMAQDSTIVMYSPQSGSNVSTGGFTKEARYEADRANVPVRLLDLDAFVRHYVEVYDRADDDTRSILPLTRIWWPA